MEKYDVLKHSPITRFVRSVFKSLYYISLMYVLSKKFPVFKSRGEITQDFSHETAINRARAIEFYIIVWIITELIISIFVCINTELPTFIPLPYMPLPLCILIGIRVIEIMQVTVNATVFDDMNRQPLVASNTRMLTLAIVNFLELCCCFGIVYAAYYRLLDGACSPVNGFYFSVITQLTIGYGDIYPSNGLRVIASIQGLFGTLFIILVVARLISSLPRINELSRRKRRRFNPKGLD